MAAAAGLLGAATLVAGGFAFRGRIVEEWQILRLESDDGSTRASAARKLAALRSPRAAEPLIEAIRRDGRERAILPEELVFCEHGEDSEGSIGLTPLARCLHDIGPAALPAIEEALKGPQDPDGRVEALLIEVKAAIEGRKRVMGLHPSPAGGSPASQ